jgi:hypothetical protein
MQSRFICIAVFCSVGPESNKIPSVGGGFHTPYFTEGVFLVVGGFVRVGWLFLIENFIVTSHRNIYIYTQREF